MSKPKPDEVDLSHIDPPPGPAGPPPLSVADEAEE
jgi:hypothetical protein